jgi:hypothetical protein
MICSHCNEDYSSITRVFGKPGQFCSQCIIELARGDEEQIMPSVCSANLELV